MKSNPITNHDYDAAVVAPLPVERAWIYRPQTAWLYSHHPSLTFFNGRYYAIWSNGRRDEDAPGQRVLIASSKDFLNWSEPTPLFDTMPGEHGERVLTAAGFHQHDGQLVAYAGAYEYRPECLDENGQRRPGDKGHTNTTLLAVTSRDGSNWSGPTDLGLPIVPNHGPQRTASGRLIISGNVSFPYTDDPCGLRNWRMTGIYPDSMADSVVDDSEGFWQVQAVAGWPNGLCEGSFYQTDDAILHMLLRTNTERLWQTESSDDGATWSPPTPTGFSDNATKFHFGRLPDGRFYYVGCPDPEPRWRRSPLVLSLSGDGQHFDRHYILADDSTPYEQQAPGMHKGGDYGYPHTLVHDGCLHVIVSRRKEAVEVLRVRDVARASSSGIGISDRQYHPEQDAPATLFQVTPNWATLMIKHGENLPHWTCESAIYHVAFRLSDSVPSEAREAWIRERDAILANAAQSGRPLSEDEEKRLQYLYSEKIERYLDAGHGVCHLKNPTIADMVANALCHFDGERYRLHAWCVMPNHVHVIAEPVPGQQLGKIVHSWKSFTANQANRALNLTGQFWQHEPYDHIIRSEKEYRFQIDYVWENPDKAGLVHWKWRQKVARASSSGKEKVARASSSGISVNDRQSQPEQDAPATSQPEQDAPATFSSATPVFKKA